MMVEQRFTAEVVWKRERKALQKSHFPNKADDDTATKTRPTETA